MTTTSVATRNGEVETLADQVIDELRDRLRGDILCPQDPGYEPARKIWNGMIDKRPGMVVRCTGVADVMQTVRFAREHDVLVSIRGGGHNVAGSAIADQGLVIDLSPMRQVHVDPARKTAHVQGGALLVDLDHETQAFGLAAPVGVVSSLDVWMLGGAAARVDATDTAFWNRDAPYLLGIEANWEHHTDADANIRWARDLFDAMQPFSDGGVYLNFPGFHEKRDLLMKAAYGPNLDRLRAVKAAYDPDDFFPGLQSPETSAQS